MLVSLGGADILVCLSGGADILVCLSGGADILVCLSGGADILVCLSGGAGILVCHRFESARPARMPALAASTQARMPAPPTDTGKNACATNRHRQECLRHQLTQARMPAPPTDTGKNAC